MNSKAKTARVITLELLVQEQKLKLKRERERIYNVHSEHAQKRNSDINNKDV